MKTPFSRDLRALLSDLARTYAARAGVESYSSRGTPGITLFPRSADGVRHGNFAPESFAAILDAPDWRARLDKPHAQRARSLPEPHNRSARELDSCTSSDALLMNVFCYPGAVRGSIGRLLGVADDTRPAFGVAGEVPLRGGRVDRTEIDMQLGDTLVEAKLTESSFTSMSVKNVERYTDLYEVFDRDALPRTDHASGDDARYLSYQLIRNVLAIAHRPRARFRVLIDDRRPDLMAEWTTLHSAIRNPAVRARCTVVRWQQLAAASPVPLRAFLALKYGL